MTNLIASRKEGDSMTFLIDGVPVAEVMVAHVRGNRVVLHCKGEPQVKILRTELVDREQEVGT
jgi:sRNA-binding carbon storage regulator CsrA